MQAVPLSGTERTRAHLESVVSVNEIRARVAPTRKLREDAAVQAAAAKARLAAL